MFNLQTAKEEIEQVAKHTTVLTEYVMALGEKVQSHESHAVSLAGLKSEILKAIEDKFKDLEIKIFGENALEKTSAVADLGTKISGLPRSEAVTHRRLAITMNIINMNIVIEAVRICP